MPADYTTPTYSSPNASQTSTSASGTSWYDWVRLGLAAKQYQDSKKAPKYASTPLSPEQKALLEMYMGSMGNPALKDNAANVNARASTILGGYNNLGWQSPKTFGGAVGYAGTRSPFAAQAGNAQPSSSTTPAGAQRPEVRSDMGGSMPLREGNLQRTLPSDMGEGPMMDESIYGWMTRNPSGASPRDYPTYFPEGQQPPAATRGKDGGGFIPGSITGQPQPGIFPMKSIEDALKEPSTFERFVKFLNGQGVKDGLKVATGLVSGGLAGAALAAGKVLWDRFIAGSKP